MGGGEGVRSRGSRSRSKPEKREKDAEEQGRVFSRRRF